jgi:hypothetical protein
MGRFAPAWSLVFVLGRVFGAGRLLNLSCRTRLRPTRRSVLDFALSPTGRGRCSART